VADEGIRGGGIYVEITPSAKDFWTRFVAQNQAAANKVGDDLGDRIGKAISARIARSIRDGVEAGGRGLSEPAVKAGTEYGGKFADGLKARLATALRNLPNPKIDADSSEADRKIADLRVRLEALRDKKVGVDIDAGAALAEVKAIKAELDALGAKSPDIRVRADTGAAAAELAALRAEVDRLDGRTINIDTNADQAASRMGLLVSAGLAIGPAIVPGAVAAAAAVLSIGSAATSAFAGIGVGALAFHGVGDAVKALDTAQQQAAKTGATLASQQKSLAGGADQVRSAEASLANARAQAADGAVRAEEQVTAAQLSATRAQRDLNDAIDTERKSRQDLAQNLKGNTLDQQQAALDVAKAKVAYEQQATEQNRISYEQAKLRAEDLGIQGKRLAAEQVVNNKTTVEGSQRVADAKAKEVAAQQAVADAERARTAQARQSAQAIAQASQAVVTAQRGIAAATVAAGATGGAAIDALAKSMGDLPVSAQTFSRFIFGLKGDLLELQGAAADGILPGAQQGIQILLPYFADLKSFVGEVADEIGDLEVRAAKTFTDPFWRSFFGFIASQAVPNLELMYQAGINVAEGLARIVQGFSPVQSTVGGGLLDLTQRFVDFSRGLDSNQGFQRFVAFAESEVPHVLSTIEALADAGVHIAAGFAPVGSVVVSELKLLATVINALPVGVITALASALTAYKTVSLITSGVQKILNADIVAGGASMLGFSTATKTATTEASAFRTGVGNVSSFLGGPLLAALSIAGTAIALLYSQYAQQKQQTDAAAQGLADLGEEYKKTGHISADTFATFAKGKPEVVELTKALKDQGLTLDDLGKSYQGNLDLQQKLHDAAKKNLDNIDAEITANRKKIAESKAGSKEEKDAIARIPELERRHRLAKQALDEYDESLAKAKDDAEIYAIATGDAADQTLTAGQNIAGLGKTLAATSGSAEDYGKAIDEANSLTTDAAGKAGVLAIAAERVGSANISAADKAKLFGNVLADIGSSAATSGPVFDALATSFSAIAQSALDANDKGKLLKQTLDQMYGAAISQNEAAEAQVRTMGALTTQLGNNSAGFDLNKAASGKNTAAILGNRDALEAALQAARDKYTQDIANNIGEDEARKTHDKTVQSILDGIPKTQRQTAAVQQLVNTYGTIPPNKATAVSTPGLDKALDDLITAHAVQEGLDKGWSRQQIANEAVALHDIVFGRQFLTGGKGQSRGSQLAAGGPVSGPGGPTDDMVPAMLSNDEHVLTAAEVRAAGGHGNVYALREMMLRGDLHGMLPGFAAGGAVGSSFPINIPTNTGAANTLALLWQQWAAAQAAAAGGTGAADLGIAKTIADVAHQLKADHKVLLSAMETALVESGMHNLKYGDRDSLGVFQQRPSQGWGSPAEVLNVAHAARSYLSRAIANESRYAKGSAGQLAQSVQRSAFPGRYDQRAAQAEAIISVLSGGVVGSGLGVAGLGGGTGPGGYRWQESVLRKAFPKISFFSDFRPGAITVSGNESYHSVGRAVDMTPSMSIFDWIRGNYGAHTKELIFTPAGGRQIKNGQPHIYSPEVAVDHYDHVHWAYRKGGAVGIDGDRILPPELLKRLQLSRMPYGVYDSGQGIVPPGLSIMDNRTRAPEIAAVLNTDTLGRLGGQPPHVEVHNYLDGREIASHTEVVIDRKLDRVASLVGSGVRD
jgi:hypothetical protein